MRFLYEKCVEDKHSSTDQFGKCPITSKQTMGMVRRFINKLKSNVGLLQNSILSKHIPFLEMINSHSFKIIIRVTDGLSPSAIIGI